MPGNPRAIVAEAELRFPVRIVIKVPGGGIGTRYKPMTDWLDENCGIRGWSITPADTRGIANDAVAIYMSSPTFAAAFVASWLVQGDPAGFYKFRSDEPESRVPLDSRSPQGLILLPPGGRYALRVPDDTRWKDERDAVEFSVILRPYEGTVRIGRRVFHGLLDQRPVEAFHVRRTRFGMIAERRLHRRELTDDGNVEITGRDLHEKTPPARQDTLFKTGGARVL